MTDTLYYKGYKQLATLISFASPQSQVAAAQGSAGAAGGVVQQKTVAVTTPLIGTQFTATGARLQMASTKGVVASGAEQKRFTISDMAVLLQRQQTRPIGSVQAAGEQKNINHNIKKKKKKKYWFSFLWYGRVATATADTVHRAEKKRKMI